MFDNQACEPANMKMTNTLSVLHIGDDPMTLARICFQITAYLACPVVSLRLSVDADCT